MLEQISVVIPTLGRPILRECLDKLLTADHWPAAVLVVDQSQSSTVAEWTEQVRCYGLDAQHIPSADRGKAAAVNRGVERVSTRYVAITDDDCLVEHDWLESLTRHLDANPDAIVTGPAHPTGTERPVSTVTAADARVSRRPGLGFDMFCGSNMGAALSTLARVGGFDEAPCFFAAAEDCEWAYRSLRLGVPIVYRPDIVVHHLGWRSTAERDDRYRLYARSHGSFYGKSLSPGRLADCRPCIGSPRSRSEALVAGCAHWRQGAGFQRPRLSHWSAPRHHRRSSARPHAMRNRLAETAGTALFWKVIQHGGVNLLFFVRLLGTGPAPGTGGYRSCRDRDDWSGAVQWPDGLRTAGSARPEGGGHRSGLCNCLDGRCAASCDRRYCGVLYCAPGSGCIRGFESSRDPESAGAPADARRSRQCQDG